MQAIVRPMRHVPCITIILERSTNIEPYSCPVVRSGKLCIEVSPDSKLAFISESLCIGCGICPKKCPCKTSRKTINITGANQRLQSMPSPSSTCQPTWIPKSLIDIPPTASSFTVSPCPDLVKFLACKPSQHLPTCIRQLAQEHH